MEKRNIIEWKEDGTLSIPAGEIWMSESEMADLFGVFIPKLRSTIKTLYKEEVVKPFEAERTIKQRRGLYLTLYNMEVVMLLALRLNSYQSRAVSRELMERTSRDHKPFKVILTAIYPSSS